MAILSQGIQTLNFVCVGQMRSGTSVVQSSISDHSQAVCHANLFNADNKVRMAAHQSYYDLSKNSERLPDWFVPGLISPQQYIMHTIFDNPLHGESAIGFRIHYPQVMEWDMFEIFDQCCRGGDFGLVHVLRNPVSCFISYKQAMASKLWTVKTDESLPQGRPAPLLIDVPELTEFVRTHESICRKLKAACDDILEVSYKSLLLDYARTMRQVFGYLHLPEDVIVHSAYRRLRNKPMQQRVFNFDNLRKSVPRDVREHLDAEDLV